MNNLIIPYNIKVMSKTLTNSKKKERYETILEPLQAVLQLALLSFCPKGTKISIARNLLHIQLPNYSQGIVRWYNNDNKDDLFYLFYACKRFPQFYSSLETLKNKTFELNCLKLLIDLAKKGLTNLAETYSNCDKIALLHTIEIYKALLDNPDKIPISEEKDKKDIEDVFVNITNLYEKQHYVIIYNTLMLLLENEESYLDYINGLNQLLSPITCKISKWVNDNVVF